VGFTAASGNAARLTVRLGQRATEPARDVEPPRLLGSNVGSNRGCQRLPERANDRSFRACMPYGLTPAYTSAGTAKPLFIGSNPIVASTPSMNLGPGHAAWGLVIGMTSPAASACIVSLLSLVTRSWSYSMGPQRGEP
jgi:hypothetical protein